MSGTPLSHGCRVVDPSRRRYRYGCLRNLPACTVLTYPNKEIAMASETTTPVAVGNAFEKGKFYDIGPDLRGGGKGHGLEIANADRLAPPGTGIIDIPNGDPNQYPERPQLVLGSESGRMPRDLEGLAGIWIISERAKAVFEAVDPSGFVFMACDLTLADGSPGDQHYLCNVIRMLDALDEGASKLKIKISDDYAKGKHYSFAGGASLVFKEDVVGSAHVFRMPFSGMVFCDRVLHDAVINAKLTGFWFIDAADR